MFFNELGLPPHEGLPGFGGPPQIDGFVEPEPGVPPPQFEFGYVNSGRFIYGGDSGIPLAVIDCVKDNAASLLYLGISTRMNISFNDSDFVMIVIRPGGPNGNKNEDLRLHIRPVSATPSGTVTGADGAVPAVATPPAPGDSAPTTANPSLPDVRGNRNPAFTTQVFERDTAASPPRVWKTRAAPTNLSVKVRSAKTGSARFWSVELQMPTDGGATWVALQSTFGLYISTGRVFTGGHGQGYVNQMPWPYDPEHAEDNVVVDPHAPFGEFLDNWDVPASAAFAGIGSGLLGSSAKGVKFLSDASGIGVLSGTSISTLLDTTTGATNKMVARVVNTAGVIAQKMRATFHVANFGINGASTPGWGANWAKCPDDSSTTVTRNPTLPVDLPAAPSSGTPTAQDITFDWHISAADHNALRLWDHTCLWVELDSIAGAGQAVNITQSSVRRNLQYTGASTVEHNATLDTYGFGLSRQHNGKHDILLHVATMPIPRQQIDPRRDRPQGEQLYEQIYGPLLAGHISYTPGSKETVGWVSVVNAYVVTNKVLTIDGRKHKVVVGGSSYGFVAEHTLEPGETAGKVDLTHALEAPGLEYRGEGLYQITVAENTRVTLKNRLATIRTDAPGCNLLVRLAQLLKKLFGG